METDWFKLFIYYLKWRIYNWALVFYSLRDNIYFSFYFIIFSSVNDLSLR